MSSSNPWIQHVKKYAAEHNLTYGCAIGDAECKKSYHSSKSAPSPVKKTEILPKAPSKAAKAKVSTLTRAEISKTYLELAKKIDDAETAREARKYQTETKKLMELMKTIK